MYYASIFAKLETPDRRDDWLLEHGVEQSIPNGGPVFSYSCDDESKYRDLAQSLADALDGLYNAVTDIRGIDMDAYAEKELAQARSVLANYREEQS